MTWKFTPGLSNPADILSRDGDPKDIMQNCLWCRGPGYLKDNCYYFQLIDVEFPLSKIEQVTQTSNISPENYMMPFSTKYSNINKMQRIKSYILKFNSNCKKLSTNTNFVTVSELQNSFFSL